MSVRIYRLLRNNKEEGPLTAEELIGKQLRTYDLIWIEGRSAAWSYPGELPEFKRYAPLPNEENNRQQLAAISASVQAAVAMNDNIVSSPEKPRYKVSAAWTKIQTTPSPAFNNDRPLKIKEPMVKTSGPKNDSLQTRSLSWEEAWLDWEKERSFDKPGIKPAADTKTNSIQSKKTVATSTLQPEIKYAESLDSLKEKYIDHLVQQKSVTKKSSAQSKIAELILPAAALIIIFSAGYWLLHNTDVNEKPITASSTRSLQPAVHSNNATNDNVASSPEKQNDETTKNSFISNGQATDRNAGRSSSKIFVQHDDAGKRQNNVSQLIASTNAEQPVAKPLNKTAVTKAVNNIAGIVPSSKITDTVNTVAANDSNANTFSATTNVLPPAKETKTTDDYVSVPSYITMNDGTGTINIQNISDINLDLVVVNVQYFTASGTFHKGETLYLHNLKAGRNVIIKTPKDYTSAYAISNISVVSADAEKVYIVGDN
jgi:hypothetical protein